MEKKLEQFQHEWRIKILRTYFFIVGLTFAGEIIFFFLRFVNSTFDKKDFGSELFISVILPSLLNFLIVFWLRNMNQSVISDKIKSHIIIYGSMGVSAVIVIFHGYINWTVCVFALPIICSVIFVDSALSHRTMLVAVLSSYISIFICWGWQRNFNLILYLIIGTLNVLFLMCVYLISRNVIAFLEQKNDIISDYGKDKDDLNYALTLDPMTNLYNHVEFEKMLETTRAECCKKNTYFSVAIADIDHFKRVNDTYGHDQGDVVLKSIANLLLEFCSDYGTVFRYGGEEFTIIFPNKTSHETLEIMEKFRSHVETVRYDFMPKNRKVTISVGIYKYGAEESVSSHDIFSNADSALYEAKSTGRNRCVIYKKEKGEAK